MLFLGFKLRYWNRILKMIIQFKKTKIIKNKDLILKKKSNNQRSKYESMILKEKNRRTKIDD
jgi:hypothetical protein